METANGTVTTHTNLAQNPSFETLGSAVITRTNLCTNPAFEAVTGYTDVRTNLIPNPSFEGTSGTTNVRTNLCTNPSFEAASSTATIRTNLATNTRGTYASPDYSGPANQTITGNIAITGHPDGITTAQRVTYAAGSSNPGITILNPLTSGWQYTASVWVYHETVGGGTQGLAQAGVASGTAPAITQGVWQRISWTFTANGTNQLGFRVSANSGAGSYLVTGLLVELRPDLAQFFDGSTAAPTNLVKTAASALSGVTLTTNVSYAGATWTRASVGVGSSGLITRQYVALTDLGAGGKTYTTSVTVANDQAFSQTISLDWCDTGNPTFTLAPGEQRRITLTSSRASYDSTFRFSDLTINQSTTEGRSILFKDWLIEEGTTSGYYYATAGEFTYSWSGTANASTSYQKAPALGGWLNASNAISWQTVVDPSTGTKAAAITTKGANGDGLYFNDITITAGKNYVMSIWIKLTSTVPSFSGILRWKDSGGTILSESGNDVVSTLVVGSWARVSVTGLAPASATTLQPMWRIYAPHTSTTFYADGCLITEGSVDQSYFDGSTASAGDFTYAWAGTANASVSYQQAPSISSWSNRWFGSTGGSGSLYQAKGGLSGTYARKLWIQPNTGSSMDVGINPSAAIAISPNTPYTISAWVRTSVAQNFNFYIEWRSDATTVVGATPTNTFTAVTANTWTRLSVTGTSPANANFALPVIGPYASALAMPSGSTMDFDNVLFESSPIVRDYFDGSNPITNLADNPNVEVNADGWATNDGTAYPAVRSTVSPISGTASFVSTRSASTINAVASSIWANGKSPTNLTAQKVSPGEIISFSMDVKVNTSNRKAATYISFRDSGGSTVSTSSQTIINLTSGAITRVGSAGVVVPAGADSILCVVSVSSIDGSNVTAGEQVWHDRLLIERSATINPYYVGTGDFTYYWTGTVNASTSVQRASKPSGIGSTWQGMAYQSGTPGNYKTRVFFHNNSIMDSGVSFSGTISLSASKTYTVSAVLTSDVARTVRFSAQGSGTVNQTTTGIALSAGVPTRVSWSFSTTATAPTNVSVYILRGETSIMGILDVDHMIVEEGSIINGKYFDGTSVEQNLIPNSNFETDTTGWWPNTATPTLTASTDRAYLGTKSLKAVGTVMSSDIAVTHNVITLKARTTYTLSYYVYSVDARTSCYIDVAATNLNLTRLGDKPVAAGVWTRVSATFTTPENIVGGTAFYLHHSGGPNNIGAIVYIDCVLLEESETLNQYYEGSGDFTYGWGGTAHASTSVQQGTSVARTNSERAFAVSTTRNGDKVVRVIPTGKGIPSMAPYTGTDVFLNLYNQPASLKPNTTYTLVSTIILEAPLSSGIAKWRVNIDSIDQSSPAFPNTVGEYTQNWQFTTGANGTINYIRFMPGPSGVAGYTNEVILKNVMIVEGPYSGKYFDGTTAAETDFSYFWTGTAHNSTSYRRGTGIAGFTSGNSLAVQSNEWSASGSKSIRITPTTTFNTTSAIIISPPLEYGKTYTALATRRLSAPLTGTFSGYYGTISFVQTGFPTQYSNVLPNVAGVAQARLTFKLDPNATTWTLRLGHGGAEGSGDVWWDNLTIVEGEYLGDHISGDNPFSKWEGTAKASTSIGYAHQFLDIAGKPARETQQSNLASTNPAANTSARTLYFVYETTAMTTSYQGPCRYGTTTEGGVGLQTQTSGLNQIGLRFDFVGGDTNRVIIFTGSRTPGRHVAAVTINEGMTSAAMCIDGGADQTPSFSPGSGWSSDYLGLGSFSETSGIRTIAFNAQHDRATRIAMSRYLGNKYGASVA
jgi:hypothetical protein